MDYRVELDDYTGPLDLLLYLIKGEEVDIYDIPIARIADRYIECLGDTSQIVVDLTHAGVIEVAIVRDVLGLEDERLVLVREVAHALVGVGLDPHAASASAAAEGVFARASHFDPVDLSLIQQPARNFINIVVASQVARVVISKLAIWFFGCIKV